MNDQIIFRKPIAYGYQAKIFHSLDSDLEFDDITSKSELKYWVSQKKRGAFDGKWHRIEPLDHHKLNFSVQPRV